MKFEIVLILTLVIASPCQSLLNTKYGNAILPVGGEDYLILPAIRSLAQAAFAKALLQDVKKVTEHLKNVIIIDKNDCAKKLICELNAKENSGNLDWDEKLLAKAICTDPYLCLPKLEFSSETLQLQVAYKVGDESGKDQCAKTYKRCPIEPYMAIEILRKRGVSLDITGLSKRSTLRPKMNATTDSETPAFKLKATSGAPQPKNPQLGGSQQNYEDGSFNNGVPVYGDQRRRRSAGDDGNQVCSILFLWSEEGFDINSMNKI